MGASRYYSTGNGRKYSSSGNDLGAAAIATPEQLAKNLRDDAEAKRKFEESKIQKERKAGDTEDKRKKKLGLAASNNLTGNQGIIGSMLNLGGSKLLGGN